MMLESFSENVIQIILTSQDLARAEKSKFVELRHLWGGLIQNKKSSAGVILDKLKIQSELKLRLQRLPKRKIRDKCQEKADTRQAAESEVLRQS